MTIMDTNTQHGSTEIDLKRYIRVEKIPGGELTESRVIKGILLNKDVTHASMRRRIEHPRIVLLDCSLEYVKPESVASMEINDAEAWDRALKNEEEAVKKMEKLIDMLEENDDVQNVYHTWEMPDDEE